MTGWSDDANPALTEYLEHLWALDDADGDCADDGLTVLASLCVASAAIAIAATGLAAWGIARVVRLLKGW